MPVPDWTYFIQPVDGGPIKIGFTATTPESRLKGLTTGSPQKLRIVGAINSNVEKELHRKFRSVRVHGEWFRATSELTSFIRTESTKKVKQGPITEQPGMPTPQEVLAEFKPLKETAWCETLLPNDANLFMDLPEFAPESEWCPDDEDADCIVSPYQALQQMTFVVDQQEFVSFVGVSRAHGWIVFFCSDWRSDSHRSQLQQLADLAMEYDCMCSSFSFAAFTWLNGRRVAIDLVWAGYTGRISNDLIYDAKDFKLFRNFPSWIDGAGI